MLIRRGEEREKCLSDNSSVVCLRVEGVESGDPGLEL